MAMHVSRCPAHMEDFAKTELVATTVTARPDIKASTVKSVQNRSHSEQRGSSSFPLAKPKTPNHLIDSLKVFWKRVFPLCNPRLHSVSYVIAVIPELCENKNGGCEHFCNVAGGNVQCSCADGYFLEQDDKSCSSNGEKRVYMIRLWE